MMADLIDRQAAYETLTDYYHHRTDIQHMALHEALNKVPSADVNPVRHGCFIGTEYDGYADGSPVFYEWKCSECGCVFEDEEPTYNYCPNCGADMRGEQNV